MECISFIPDICIQCQRSDLAHDIVIDMTNKNSSKNVLCLTCETLMIISTDEKNELSLIASPGKHVIIRSATQ